MIEYAEALTTVLKHTRPLGSERVGLQQCLGFVLAKPVRARFDSPRFSQSAMDGYAVRATDLRGARPNAPVRLQSTGASYAGKPSPAAVCQGTAVKIMTGALLPRGADAVVMKEVCKEEDRYVVVRAAVRCGENVRRQGEEYRKGAVLLPAGTRITPPVIALLASAGYATVTVHRRPKVVLMVTGDELRRPSQSLRKGEIHDSNSYALAGALQEPGIKVLRTVHVGDRESDIQSNLRRSLGIADIVVTVGGVSVGDRDLVKPILEDLGVRTIFWKVAIKPGKPNYFGIYLPTGRRHNKASRTLVFGLPGNPVSALLSFHQLVKPALLRMLGVTNDETRTAVASLTVTLHKKPGRLEWVRGIVGRNKDRLSVTPTIGQESHMLTGLARAECLIEFPAEKKCLRAGERVHIQYLEWKP